MTRPNAPLPSTPMPQSRPQRRLRFQLGLLLGILSGASLGIAMGSCSESKVALATDGGVDAADATSSMDAADASMAMPDGLGDATADGATAAYGCSVPLTHASDVQFIDFMVPHHKMATHMAEMVVAKGAREDVKQFARKVIAAQSTEIAQMRATRTALTGSAESPPAPADPKQDAAMAMMMNLSGAELDKMFLEDMRPHHAEAMSVAHRSLDSLRQPEMRTLAQRIIDDQAAEIGELQALLNKQ